MVSNWFGDYILGSPSSYNPFADVLLIQNSGVFTIGGFSDYGFLLGSSNNTALVTDPGSALLLSGLGEAAIGFGGIGDSLVISNGGKLVTDNPQFDIVVDGSSGSGILVTGPGSVWSNTTQAWVIDVGNIGSGNSVAIRNGGLVVGIYIKNTRLNYSCTACSN